jgi:hypothetical protein
VESTWRGTAARFLMAFWTLAPYTSSRKTSRSVANRPADQKELAQNSYLLPFDGKIWQVPEKKQERYKKKEGKEKIILGKIR